MWKNKDSFSKPQNICEPPLGSLLDKESLFRSIGRIEGRLSCWETGNVSGMRLLIFLVCFLCGMSFAFAQNSDEGLHQYFYHGITYGSQAEYNPISYIINGGFDILQTENQSRNLSAIKYLTGVKNVIFNLSSPFTSIRAYGVKQFFADEILPISANKKNMQWLPNYQLHLIGGGMEYRAMAEWYSAHGFEFPKTASFITMAAQHFVNEVIENNGYVGRTVDPIADIYVFDPLGVLLFSFDPVCEFFSQTLNLTDWSYQPAYNPTSGNLENAGQNFIMKYKFPFDKKYALFYHFGMNGLAGLSYEFRKDESFSLAAGLRNSELVEVTDETGGRKQTAVVLWNAGFFYDRNNSLLFSILVSGQRSYRVVTNIYPGLVSIAGFSPGFFVAYTTGRTIAFGINVSYVPIGLATNFTAR